MWFLCHWNIEFIWPKDSLRVTLTHFQPLFHLRINQIAGFYKQNVSKTPLEE